MHFKLHAVLCGGSTAKSRPVTTPSRWDVTAPRPAFLRCLHGTTSHSERDRDHSPMTSVSVCCHSCSTLLLVVNFSLCLTHKLNFIRGL